MGKQISVKLDDRELARLEAYRDRFQYPPAQAVVLREAFIEKMDREGVETTEE